MSGKEKIYFLLNRLEDQRVLTPSGQPILFHPFGDLAGNYSEVELGRLLVKLQDDEKIIRITKMPKRDEWGVPDYEQEMFGLELLPAFDDYYEKIQNEPEYQEFSNRRPAVKVKPKLSRKSLEKIWNVLQDIENKRGITPIHDDISIPFVHFSKVKDDAGASNASDERRNILRKLESEEHAIKDVRFPDNLQEYVYLKIGDKYFEVYDEYQKQYKEVAEEYEQTKQVETQSPQTLFEITYTPSREVLFNKTFLLSKPDFDTENDLVFSHLYKNPNQKFTLQEIEEVIGKKLIKDLHKVVENLGFKADLRKIFFSVSGTSISFRNPVTQEDLEALGIKKIRIT